MSGEESRVCIDLHCGCRSFCRGYFASNTSYLLAMVPEFLIAGHLTCDLIQGREQPGGSTLYGSKAAEKMGYACALWTCATENFPPTHLFEKLDVVRSSKDRISTFAHELFPESGTRRLTLNELAEPLQIQTLPQEWKKCPRVMISPIWDEVGPEALSWFETDFIGITPQGWFRRRKEGGEIYFTNSKWSSLPRKAKLIVVSVDDIAQDQEAWEWIKASAHVAVKTMGRKGHLLATEEGEVHLQPPHISNEVDPTGAGDVFASAMLIALSEGLTPEDAACFASVAASFVVEKPGIIGLPTREELMHRLKCQVPFSP